MHIWLHNIQVAFVFSVRAWHDIVVPCLLWSNDFVMLVSYRSFGNKSVICFDNLPFLIVSWRLNTLWWVSLLNFVVVHVFTIAGRNHAVSLLWSVRSCARILVSGRTIRNMADQGLQSSYSTSLGEGKLPNFKPYDYSCILRFENGKSYWLTRRPFLSLLKISLALLLTVWTSAQVHPLQPGPSPDLSVLSWNYGPL